MFFPREKELGLYASTRGARIKDVGPCRADVCKASCRYHLLVGAIMHGHQTGISHAGVCFFYCFLYLLLYLCVGVLA